MTKHLKKLVGPLVSLFFLLNMTSVGYAESTAVSYTHLTLPTT